MRDAGSSTAEASLPLVIEPGMVAFAFSGPLPGGTTGRPYSFQMTARDGRPPYRWSVRGRLPAGLELSAEGLLHGTPTEAGRFDLIVAVTDADGRKAEAEMYLTIENPVTPLAIKPPGPIVPGIEREMYTFLSFEATGGGGNYTWSASGLPSGLHLQDASVVGTPAAGSRGTYSVLVTVRD
ncbi:MAG: putative Ig domain-containing protein, partial [Acidobacteria bacterium]|nr:putative Ig domain-containing protein [Acidobacteriota bacterium]